MENNILSLCAYNNNDFIEKCRDIVAEYEREVYQVDLSEWDNCKSPIERMLWCSLRTIQKLSDIPVAEPCDCPGCQTQDTYHLTEGIDIEPQHKIDKYTVDIRLILSWINRKQHPYKYCKSVLLVEADSQEWHERTEKERRYEKKRDRYLLSEGYKVIHYTGKEILDQPLKTAIEILTILTKDSHRFCIYGGDKDDAE